MGHFHLETRKPPRTKRRRLIVALVVTLAIMAVEIVGGILSGSIALLSDAGHMFTHAFALGVSFFALVVSSRPPDLEKTYGYFRSEVLVALLNGLLLIGITVFIFFEAARRLISPVHINSSEMFLIALLGLIANGVSVLLLSGVSRHDINLRSAFLHVAYDTASSVVVIISALLIRYTGFLRLDPIVSVGIGLLILLWCYNLIRDSVNILLESTPVDVDIARMRKDILGIRMVQDIHDVHVWQLTSDMYILTAHLVVQEMPLSRTEGILSQVNNILSRRYRIGHSTIQLEVHDRSVDISSPRERSSPREQVSPPEPDKS